MLEIDDVYAVTSELSGSPQASAELLRSESVKEGIPRDIYGRNFFSVDFKTILKASSNICIFLFVDLVLFLFLLL